MPISPNRQGLALPILSICPWNTFQLPDPVILRWIIACYLFRFMLVSME